MADRSDIQKPQGTDLISQGDDAITTNAEVLESVWDTSETALGHSTGALGAITSAEQYLLHSADDSTYAIPHTDQLGHVAGGVTPAGRFNFELPPTVGGDVSTFQPVAPNGYAFAFVDRDGYVAAAITEDGTLVSSKSPTTGIDSLAAANDWIGYTSTRSDAITTIGDSLTHGYFGGSAGPISDSWPTHLKTLLGSDVAVTNLGVSGYTVDEEAIKVGAFNVPLTVAGGSIPADGEVSVTTSEGIGFRPVARNFTGTLAGVPGTLSHSSAGDLTFKRTAPGDSTPVEDNDVFHSDETNHSDEILTVFLGRNNITFNVGGDSGGIVDHVVSGIARIVDWQSRDISKVLVFSVTNRQSETRGTAGYNTVAAINDRLSDMYGPRYLDIRTPLVHGSLDAMDISPTQDDLDAMAADAPPPSIMDDDTHWTPTGHEFVSQLVYQYLSEREWTK